MKLLTQESFHKYRWSMIVLLLTMTDVSTTSAVVIYRVKVSCITSVTTARVVQTSVTVNNSPIQDYVHPDDHAYSIYFLMISCYDLSQKSLHTCLEDALLLSISCITVGHEFA